MSQYICPGCGSTYLKLVNKEELSVFQLAEGYILRILQGDFNLDHQRLSPEKAIECGACSWRGAVADLELSELAT